MKRAILCYLPPLKRTPLFLAHIRSFTTQVPLIFLSDTNYDVAGLQKVATLIPGLKYIRYTPVSSSFATQAFIVGLKYAVAAGIDEFMWLEDDCYVTQNNWDVYPWTEFGLNPKAVCGGSPVFTNPCCLSHQWEQALFDYGYRYQEKAGVSMALEGGVGVPLLYPNGAFAIYKTAFLLDVFADALEDYVANREKAAPYDYAIGVFLEQQYGLEVFNKVVPTPSIYSGCGEYHYTTAERKQLVSTKVGVHKWFFA